MKRPSLDIEGAPYLAIERPPVAPDGPVKHARPFSAVLNSVPRAGNGRRVKGTRTHNSWRSMLDRCRNPNIPHYGDYGGRGITVCERWLTFANFLADMGERPEGLTLDRIDNDGNYEPGNCRWATWSEQQRNKRPRVSGPCAVRGVAKCGHPFSAVRSDGVRTCIECRRAHDRAYRKQRWAEAHR